MNPEIDMPSWLTRLRVLSLAAREAVLLGSIAMVWLLATPLSLPHYGWAGPLAAAIAAAVCAVASGLALWASDPGRAGQNVFQGLLCALLFRTGIPMAFALVAHVSARLLTWAGLGYWLVLFYLVALGGEVLLSLPHNRLPRQHPAGNSVN